MRKKRATREWLGLSRAEFATLQRLRTPERIQSFLNDLRQNFELQGETCNSVRTVLRERRAHCIEGAMLAACALWIHGEPPLLLDFEAVHDFDHVVAVFRRNGRWGAISKTNGIGLRWRDPVYRTLRELAMSYFEHYYNPRGEKTLRGYGARPVSLTRFDSKVDWRASDDNVWEIPEYLCDIAHRPVLLNGSGERRYRMDRRLYEAGFVGSIK
jgi:hypothetical protein